LHENLGTTNLDIRHAMNIPITRNGRRIAFKEITLKDCVTFIKRLVAIPRYWRKERYPEIRPMIR
jgi:hypothetical protein